MPIKSKAQFRLIMAKRKQYENIGKAPKEWKWIFDTKFDSDLTDYDKLKWRVPKDEEKKEKYKKTLNKITKEKAPHGLQYHRALKKIKGQIMDDYLYEIINNDIKNFHEYKKEAETIDSIYINMVESFNNYNNDLNDITLNNLSNILNEEVYLETASIMTIDIYKNIVKNATKNKINNAKDFEKIVLGYLNSQDNMDKIRQQYISTAKQKTQKPEEEVKKIVNKHLQSYEGMNDEDKIAKFSDEIRKIKKEDYSKYFSKIFSFNDKEEVKTFAKKIKNMLDTFDFSVDLKTICEKFHDMVSYFHSDEGFISMKQDIDKAKSENPYKSEEHVKLIAIFNSLEKANLFEDIHITFLQNESDLTEVMNAALSEIGQHSTAGDRQKQILYAKKATIAYILIMGILIFVNVLSSEEESQQENQQENKPKVGKENTNITQDGNLNEEILKKYQEEIYNEISLHPIKFAEQKVLKFFNTTDFKSLLLNSGTFKKQAKVYMSSTDSSLKKLETILKSADIEIKYQLITQATDEDKGYSRNNLEKAKQQLNKFLKNKGFINKVAKNLLKQYGVKQSLGAKIGQTARETFDTVKNKFEPVSTEQEVQE